MRCGSFGSSQNGLLDQLAHRRQDAVAGEVEPMGEPALAGEEADELLGGGGVAAGLEDHGARLMMP